MPLNLAALSPFALASAMVFGPAAGFLARRAARSPVVWLLYGAVLGPIAVVLLLLAPPGHCLACGRESHGWSGECLFCDADLRTGWPAGRAIPAADPEGDPTGADRGSVRDALAAPPVRPAPRITPAVGPSGTPDDWPPRWPTLRGAESMSGERAARTPLAQAADHGRQRSPGTPVGDLPVVPRRSDSIAPMERRSDASLTGAVGPANANRDGVARAEPPRARSRTWPAELEVHRDVNAREQALVGTTVGSSLRMIMSAVSLSGTSGLTIGARYGVAVEDAVVLFIGPLGETPSTIRAALPASHLEVTALEDRILMSTTGRSTAKPFFAAFVQVQGMSLSDVESVFAGVGVGQPRLDVVVAPQRPQSTDQADLRQTSGHGNATEHADATERAPAVDARTARPSPRRSASDDQAPDEHSALAMSEGRGARSRPTTSVPQDIDDAPIEARRHRNLDPPSEKGRQSVRSRSGPASAAGDQRRSPSEGPVERATDGADDIAPEPAADVHARRKRRPSDRAS